ncbi:hypothetical protein [Synechocystis sp. CACIAM 05]|uniref:hypothetical protein n=1 Tax=Synechocystis sp. CACIAM 05 TaxID=1933929 RepID=UPI001F43A49A|nr:hypothetical protein [Synechocystis sp. CACIAM 05]
MVWADKPEKEAKVVNVHASAKTADFKMDFIGSNMDFSRFSGFIINSNSIEQN